MADEIGRSPAGTQAPDFLTVSQTALVLQLGRSTTYGLVGRFVETSGVEGIPAVLVGGQYRVPRARLEELTGGPLTWPPAARERTPRRRPAAGGGAVDSASLADEPQRSAEVFEAVVRDLRVQSAAEHPALLTPADSAGDVYGAGGDPAVDHADLNAAAQVESNPPTDTHRSSSVVWSQSSLPFAG